MVDDPAPPTRFGKVAASARNCCRSNRHLLHPITRRRFDALGAASAARSQALLKAIAAKLLTERQRWPTAKVKRPGAARRRRAKAGGKNERGLRE
jgi:hypothetical protein